MVTMDDYSFKTEKGITDGASSDDDFDFPTEKGNDGVRPLEPRPGDRLVDGRYEVIEELGRGGMGVVYRCLDRTAGIEVALKALPPELSHNKAEMEEVRENFQLVSRLVHQNIAVSKSLELDKDTSDCYLVMEYVKGVSLRHWMHRMQKERGSIPLEEALAVLRQVAEALDYAHELKVIHRDIKPSNVMLTLDGKAKVMDFGLAAQIYSSLTHISRAYHGTSGTRAYMAPEQWRGKPQGASADQYALAVMAYEMLGGRLPFDSSDAEVLKQAVLEEAVEPIKGIPSFANAALRRALSKEATDRFASCTEFITALEGGHLSSIVRPSAMRLVVGVAVVMLIAVGGIAIYHGKTPSAPSSPIAMHTEQTTAPASKPVVPSETQLMEKSIAAEPDVDEPTWKWYSRSATSPQKKEPVEPDKATEFVISFVNGTSLKLIKVKAGNFFMGHPRIKIEYSIALTRDYWLGETEITQRQWETVMNTNPSVFRKGGRYGRYLPQEIPNTREHPVENVSWNDAREFCQRLNNLFSDQIPPQYTFDLPSEAQWEFAAKGGIISRGYEHSGSDSFIDVAWCAENSGVCELSDYSGDYRNDQPKYKWCTHPVKGKLPNELGLYDMNGNVQEWCRDVFVNQKTISENPEFPKIDAGALHITKGGNYHLSGKYMIHGSRAKDGMPSTYSDSVSGFRIALVPQQ